MYTVESLKNAGMTDEQINAIMNTLENGLPTDAKTNGIKPRPPVSETNGVVSFAQKVEDERKEDSVPMVPTSIHDLQSYTAGSVQRLPDFSTGQPFVARLKRPSMLVLAKSGKIPNSLLESATNIFANGSGSLSNGRSRSNIGELHDVLHVVCEAALLEPTLADIESVGLELSDDQMMAIFSYTQQGVEALKPFRNQ